MFTDGIRWLPLIVPRVTVTWPVCLNTELLRPRPGREGVPVFCRNELNKQSTRLMLDLCPIFVLDDAELGELSESPRCQSGGARLTDWQRACSALPQ